MAGFKDFTSETLLSTDVDNLLMKQANIAVNTGSEPTGEEGMEVHNLNADRVRIYNGSAWIRTGWWSSAGRTGCTLRRNANQSITTAVETTISWDNTLIDTDGFCTIPSGSVVVPTGLSGLYMTTVRTAWSGSVGSSLGGQIAININGTQWCTPLPNGSINHTASVACLPWAAGDTLTATVIQTSGGTLTMTARLDHFRLGA